MKNNNQNRNNLKLFILAIVVVFTMVSSVQCKAQNSKENTFNILTIEKDRILKLADSYKALKPITVVDSVCNRSAGGAHDFYSEGDYWWPDPNNPDGPYIRKDGLTNPNNFTAHREAMIRFSEISGALASAYIITKNEVYVEALLPHLKAWFIDEATVMNPNLLYAQAIQGVVTGRGIGIIDTIHLMEVAKAVRAIENSKTVSIDDIDKIKAWFNSYLNWITTHEYGIQERDNGNNHSTCWFMQVAVFAELTDNFQLLEYCRKMYKDVLLPNQMAVDGSFPLEIKRTKPYGYSIFNLDAMTAICQIVSIPSDNLFEYETTDGKSIKKGISFLYPYLKSKNEWPYQKDVMYWDEWPVRSITTLFGGLAYKNSAYLELWKSLPTHFKTSEVVRNTPIRFPILWLQ